MKAKHQRLVFLLVSLCAMALGVAGILSAFRDNLVFFYTPSQWIEKSHAPDFKMARSVRIGGLVKKGSVVNLKTGGIRFIVTDLTAEMPVTYQGLVPSLFREGQGVIAQGVIQPDHSLAAETILAKHDENYMPREVVDALKASGRWREDGGYGKTK